MAIIQIKRISSHPYGIGGTDLLLPLYDGELGYVADENKLYIGYNGENILINDSSGLGPLLEEIKKSGIGRLSWDPETLELKVYDIEGTQVTSKYVKLEHTHKYAGSASAGGAANSAIKLVAANGTEFAVGSSSKPVYFVNGIPTECGNTLDVSITGNASTANQLAEGRTFTIGGTAADGGTSFNGSSNVALKIPKTLNGFTSITSSKFVGNLEGNSTSANKLSVENTGLSDKPVYFANGVPVECDDDLNVNIKGNASTASQLVEGRSISIDNQAADSSGVSFNGSQNVTLKIPRTLTNFTSIASSKFVGNLEGNATSAGKLLTENVGSADRPIYFANGIPIICDDVLDVNIKGEAELASQLANSRTISISGVAGTTGTAFNGSKNISLIIPPTLSGFTSISSTKFVGNLEGNASTASAFKSAQNIALTGDVIGSHSSTGGWSIATTLKELHTAEGQGGPSANATLAHDGTFTVPYFEYDKNGRITAAVNRTYTLPSDNNTDTKVTQNAAITTAGEYPIILGFSTATTAVTDVVNKTTTLKYNPSTQILTAPKFKGAFQGNADTATTWQNGRTFTINGTAADGGVTVDGSKNIALNIPTTIDGFTSVSSTKFVGNLEGVADEAKKLSSSAGSNVKPIYFANGIPLQCSDTLDVNISKNAATADHWKNTITFTYKNDATGTVTFDGSTNKDVNLTLANSGVTAGNYGPSANTILDFASTFNVPKYTVDAKGRITSSGTVTYTLPNVGVYVNNLSNQTIAPDGKIYKFTALDDLNFDDADNQVNATENEYILNLESFAHTAEVQDKIDAIPKPMIFKGTVGTNGTVTTLPAASASTIGHTYRVISSFTVNGTTSTPGDLWICAELEDKTTNPPTKTYNWVHVINTDETHVASAAQADKWTTARTFSISGAPSDSTTSVDGSKNVTLYIPKTIGKFTKVSATTFEGALSGNATTATTATKLSANAGDADTPVYFANGVPVACDSTLDVDIKGTSTGWTTGRKITLDGPVKGNVTINGSTDVTLTTAIDDIYVLNSGDTMTGHLTLSSSGAQSAQPAIKWGTIGSANPYIGYATDQTDGTFALMSIEGTNYASGLAIGGSSKNLLWKGVAVATISSTVASANQLATARTISISGTPGTSGTSFDGSKNISLILPKTIGKFDKISATTLEGALTGNASSATEFANNATIALTGDVTGSGSGKNGWSISTTLANTAVTAGNYGPSENKTLAHSGTFTVPYVEVDSKGRITGAYNRTFTLPSDNNTDTKVTQAYSTTNNSYPLLFTATSGITSTSSRGATTAILNNSIYANPSTGTITATKFVGNTSDATKADFEGTASNAFTWANARTFDITGGVAADAVSVDGSANVNLNVTSMDESYLNWGSKTLAGSISPVDAAASSIHSANRFQFAKPAGITIEYSRDAGSTWTAYSTNDQTKVNLVSGIGANYYIGSRSGTSSSKPVNTTSDQLRITLNATNMGFYTRLRKLLINISTNYASGSKVKVEKAMKGSESTFSTIGTYGISGWSGWNSIPIGASFGGGATQTSNIAVLRLTFSITGVHATSNSALTVLDLVGIGETYWAYTSNMGKTGHLYSWDYLQNATFPANVTATKFIGPLQGNADTATAWAAGRKVTFTGDTTGSFTIDGSANVSCELTVANDSHSHSNYMSSAPSSIELNSAGSLATYGGFIDFHYHDSNKKPLDTSGAIVDKTPDYTSRIIENAPGQIEVNGAKFKNGLVTATKFKGELEGNASTASQLAEGRSISISGTPGTSGTTFDGSKGIELILPLTIGKFTKVSADSFVGPLSGNASSATAFSSDATVKLTGAVTGEAKSTKGWTIETTLTSIHSTGGNGGPSTAPSAALAHSGTFTVPYFEYDAQGRITTVANRTYTLPADKNTDTKVTQAAATTAVGEYPVILGYSTATTAVTNTVNKAAGFTYNPSTKVLTATTFNGALNGNADTASTWEESRNFSISKTAADDGTTDKNPIKVAVNGSTDTVLQVPTQMSGFDSITSNKFVGQASRALKLETYTNSNKQSTYGDQWQVAAYWETGNGPIRLVSDQNQDKYKVKVDQADLADKATLADAATIWATNRNFSISDYTDKNQGVNSSVNGSQNVDLKMPKSIEVSTISVNKSETTGTGVQMKYDATDESLMFVFA